MIKKHSFSQEQVAILLAGVLFLLSATAFFSTYLQAQGAQGSIATSDFIITEGEQRYEFRNGDGCVGGLTVDLQRDDSGYRLLSKGGMRVLADQVPQKILLSVEGAFNSLGQLGGSIATLTGSDFSLRFGSTKVRPIKVRIDSQFGSLRRSITEEVEGPLLLTQIGPKKFKISHPELDRLKSSGESLMPLSNLPVKIKAVEKIGTSCSGGKGSALDITAYLMMARMMAGGLTIPGMP